MICDLANNTLYDACTNYQIVERDTYIRRFIPILLLNAEKIQRLRMAMSVDILWLRIQILPDSQRPESP